MSFYVICWAFVIVQTVIFAQSNERDDDLLEWYYKQSPVDRNRIARQVDYNDYSDDNDNDDWYVFDRVEEPQPQQSQINNNARNVRPWQNPNQIINNQNSRPLITTTTTTPQPIIPNAGPPRLPPCEENCNMRTTSEYNPVCGTNGVTYYNNGRFECARFCGLNVEMKNQGRCGPLLPF